MAARATPLNSRKLRRLPDAAVDHLPLQSRKPLLPTTAAEQHANVTQWMPMAARTAMRSALMQDADRDDAIGAAFLQLCLSARRYDPAQGTQFSTLACSSVTFHMLTEFHRRAGRGFAGTLRGKHEAPKTRCIEGLAYSLQPVEEPHDEEPEHPMAAELRQALGTLTDREYFIVVMRIVGGRTLKLIAEALGITRERVRQIQEAAMRKLRAALVPIGPSSGSGSPCGTQPGSPSPS